MREVISGLPQSSLLLARMAPEACSQPRTRMSLLPFLRRALDPYLLLWRATHQSAVPSTSLPDPSEGTCVETIANPVIPRGDTRIKRSELDVSQREPT